MRNEPSPPRNRYCYVLKIDDEVVFHGFTTDLERKEKFHQQRRYPTAKIEQIGEPVTHFEAFNWKRSYRPIVCT